MQNTSEIKEQILDLLYVKPDLAKRRLEIEIKKIDPNIDNVVLQSLLSEFVKDGTIEIFSINLTYYKVVKDHFIEIQRESIQLDKIKCIETIQKMVDLIRKKKIGNFLNVLNSKQHSSTADLFCATHKHVSTIYKLLKLLTEQGIIKQNYSGERNSKGYTLTFYGRMALKRVNYNKKS